MYIERLLLGSYDSNSVARHNIQLLCKYHLRDHHVWQCRPLFSKNLTIFIETNVCYRILSESFGKLFRYNIICNLWMRSFILHNLPNSFSKRGTRVWMFICIVNFIGPTCYQIAWAEYGIGKAEASVSQKLRKLKFRKFEYIQFLAIVLPRICEFSYFRVWTPWAQQKDWHLQLLWRHANLGLIFGSGKRKSILEFFLVPIFEPIESKPISSLHPVIFQFSLLSTGSIRGRCYDHNFLQILTIFGKKLAFFSQTNVMIQFLHNLALFSDWWSGAYSKA
jgi:hypothetical protein